MGNRTSYPPGMFCAVDLATTDPEGAKGFYRSLFGWEPEDVPGPNDTTFTVLRLAGDAVAGLFEQRADQREAGLTPAWVNYVSVSNADETAAKARDLGGQVVVEPFDILDVGRMAVLRDPTGANVAIWQPGTYAGVARVNEPGCLTWNELATSDVTAALSFYGELFGWSGEEMQSGEGPSYTVIRVGERANGGIRALFGEEEGAGIPSHWFPYFAVESLDDTIAKCGELRGSKAFGPVDFPAGRIAGLRDEQAATFAIWEGELED